MNLELCDLCHKKEPNKRFKIKMSAKGYYRKQNMAFGGVIYGNHMKKFVFVKIVQRNCLV